MIGVLKFQVLFLIFFSFWTEKLLISQEKIWKYYKETVSKSKSLPREKVHRSFCGGSDSVSHFVAYIRKMVILVDQVHIFKLNGNVYC